MDWIFVAAAVVCGWAFLSIIGGERQRKLYELASRIPPEPVEPEPAVEEPIVVGGPVSQVQPDKP